ncbi:TPA: single-stranded-DNA-specific exonuclease RecJ [Candidatus Saccharibacteria bacterium]|nr:single-stranded-DNA-specific exonuclease RecJ [Candidatus Saccharibacteria bacterium]HIO87194.1 single-stranded-DNA-specific exonuclease RecJ [Candidatus Saccharibacteria bacterium]
MNTKKGSLFNQVLLARGLRTEANTFFEAPYSRLSHNPYLLTDMNKAVTRIVHAKKTNEKICVYGDYDIDGLTATTVLLDAFKAFGIDAFAHIPNRFSEGYGLNNQSLDAIKSKGADLVITVDCGSTSISQAAHARDLGLDLIITDHHTVSAQLPDCVAVINPKRTDNDYPFIDLAGVGVAFKLVQALQSELDGLPAGQEKWLMDLVSLGTVCDVVELQDENRMLVKWGTEVMKKTRRPGIQALLDVAATNRHDIDAATFGFRLGPRLNASGRLEHAQLSLDLLTATAEDTAVNISKTLEEMNSERRRIQSIIYEEAINQVDPNDDVIVVASDSWSHGVVGIVASKLVEKYRKPAFVMQHLGDGTTKGSARSFGSFKAVDAIRSCGELIISGGGHAAAGGCTIATKDFDGFKKAINAFYASLNLSDQIQFLRPPVDVELEDLSAVTVQEIAQFKLLEPFGRGNPEPHFLLTDININSQRLVGAQKNHLQLTITDKLGTMMRGIMFGQSSEITESISPIVTFSESSYRPGDVEFQIKFV